jgi:hypothetical protein
MKRMVRTQESLARACSRRAGAPIILAIAALVMLALACGTASPQTDTAMTAEALNAQATDLAAQFQQLTAQAAAPPTESQPVVPSPTEAPTESPYMEGSMVRAPYDPAAEMGEPDVYEDFDGSSGIFATLSGGAASSWYGNGRYHITFVTRGMWTWYFGDPSAADFYADVLVFNGEQCVAGDSAGLLFHGYQMPDAVLLFGVTCDGRYYLGFSGGPGPEGIVCTWTGTPNPMGPCPKEVSEQSELIDAGPGAVNRLGILTQGGSFTFYVNGHQIDQYNSPFSPYFLEGLFGLFLGTGQKNDASASFDDFSLWRNP